MKPVGGNRNTLVVEGSKTKPTLGNSISTQYSSRSARGVVLERSLKVTETRENEDGVIARWRVVREIYGLGCLVFRFSRPLHVATVAISRSMDQAQNSIRSSKY
ncbi:unnamed protein product [Lasius platythorax]|uniref:Uncharacterized protein n=1 Tax=Lasius platythorax TaxID=488582 RepID=A0AAV2NBU9_9HYME